jgi:hypothetical protein
MWPASNVSWVSIVVNPWHGGEDFRHDSLHQFTLYTPATVAYSTSVNVGGVVKARHGKDRL